MSLRASRAFPQERPAEGGLAFKTFSISKEFQDLYGYPELTDEIRRKVFGLNAAKRLAARERAASLSNLRARIFTRANLARDEKTTLGTHPVTGPPTC
jgi:hypothetical protein